MKHQVPLYLFGTPGPVGGASTKILDLLPLLSRNFDVKLVLGPRELRHKPLIQYLTANSYNFLSRAKFPRKAYGIALAICELDFFSSGQAQRVKDAGLKLVWSNEMMWPFAGESDAVRCGLVDHVLFLSTIQQDAFREMYRGVKQSIVGNYIAPDSFPFIDRHNAPDFSIGRLSRPDPVKYPCNFPFSTKKSGFLIGVFEFKRGVGNWHACSHGISSTIGGNSISPINYLLGCFYLAWICLYIRLDILSLSRGGGS